MRLITETNFLHRSFKIFNIVWQELIPNLIKHLTSSLSRSVFSSELWNTLIHQPRHKTFSNIFYENLDSLLKAHYLKINP